MFAIVSNRDDQRSSGGTRAMLIGLLVHGYDRSRIGIRPPRLRVSRYCPRRSEAVLDAIARTQSEFGDRALTDGERIIWNTALLLSVFTTSIPVSFARDARVRSWAAARNGLIAMGLRDAADCTPGLVKELAYRTEQPRRNRDAEAASLQRLARLKQGFCSIEIQDTIPAKLENLIEQIYPWAD